jgi:hypothetical protein
MYSTATASATLRLTNVRIQRNAVKPEDNKARNAPALKALK